MRLSLLILVLTFTASLANAAAPTHGTPVLNSTLNSNNTNWDLTVYNVSTADGDGNAVKNIHRWILNSTSFENFIMDFEGGSNATFTKDYSPYGNNGTVTGATWSATSGYDGFGAYSFDGTNDYINVPDNAAINITGQALSVSFWMKNSSVPAGNDVVMMKTTNTGWSDGYGFYFSSGTKLRFFVTAYGTNFADATFPTGNWAHVVGTFDGTAVKIYFNGVLAAIDSYGGSITATTNSLQIGRGASDTYNFNGFLDDIRIYNWTLTREEIYKLYVNRTEVIPKQELGSGATWQACITPTDGGSDGSEKCSNSHSILSNSNTPTHGTPVLNASHSSNNTDANLTLYNISTADGDSDSVTNLIDWFVNGTSYTLLYLPFELSSSNSTYAKDYSLNGNNGSVTNATLFNSGYDGFGAYLFNGVNSFVNVSDSSTMNFGNDQDNFTIMTRFKTYSLSSTSTILIDAQTANPFYGYALRGSSGTLSFSLIWNGGTTGVTSTTTYSDNNWHFAAITYNGTTLSMFVDGVLEATAAPTIGNFSNAEAFHIGRTVTGWNGGYFDGYIDEIYVMNRSLTFEQTEAYRANSSNTTISNETAMGDSWQACIIPIDGSNEGIRRCSNTMQVPDYSTPTHGTPILNSSSNANATSNNITVYNISTDDGDDHSVKNIIEWYLNSSSFENLILPFETITSNSTYTKDYGYYARNGTVSGATHKPLGGYDGFGAYQFDGSDDSITVSANSAINISGNITVSVWVKATSAPSQYKTVLMKASSGSWNDGYGLFFNSANTIHFFIDHYSNNVATASITATNWNHVVGTYNGSTVRIYVNGVEGTSDSYSNGITWANTDLLVGKANGGYNLAASIDDLRIYNRTLTAQEVQALYLNKTDIIDSSQLAADQTWQACITLLDRYDEGTRKCSNSITTRNVETTPPNVTIYSPLNSTYYSINVPLNVVAQDNSAVDSCWFSLNGGTNTSFTCANNYTQLILPEGQSSLDVYVNDTSSNENSSSVIFTTSYTVTASQAAPSASNSSYLILSRTGTQTGSNIADDVFNSSVSTSGLTGKWSGVYGNANGSILLGSTKLVYKNWTLPSSGRVIFSNVSSPSWSEVGATPLNNSELDSNLSYAPADTDSASSTSSIASKQFSAGSVTVAARANSTFQTFNSSQVKHWNTTFISINSAGSIVGFAAVGEITSGTAFNGNVSQFQVLLPANGTYYVFAFFD